jgi:hypothetical protein
MHDMDGKYGLLVDNGFGDTWRAFGDGKLDATVLPPSSAGRKVLARIRDVTVRADLNANKQLATEAVGAAMKQLHYEAHRNLAGSPNSANFKNVLDATRATGTQNLRWDEYAEGTPVDGNSLDDKIAMSISDKLAFMDKYRPRPRATGSTKDDLLRNHPPLFDGTGTLDQSKAYSFSQTTKESIVDAGFTLVLDWQEHDSLPFATYYQLARATKDWGRWAGQGEKTLEDVRAQLKKRVVSTLIGG